MRPRDKKNACRYPPCNNEPGEKFKETGYCGKHQTMSSLANPSSDLSNILNSSVRQIDFANPEIDPWQELEEELGIDYWTIIEMDELGKAAIVDIYQKRHGRKESEAIELADQAEESFGKFEKFLNQMYNQILTYKGEMDEAINDREPWKNEFWFNHAHTAQAFVIAWEMSELQTETAEDLRIELRSCVEASDPNNPTWFEVFAQHGCVWSQRIREDDGDRYARTSGVA